MIDLRKIIYIIEEIGRGRLETRESQFRDYVAR